MSQKGIPARIESLTPPALLACLKDRPLTIQLKRVAKENRANIQINKGAAESIFFLIPI